MTDSGPLLWEYLGDVLEISRKTGWKTGLKYDLGYNLKSGLKYDLKITCTVSLYPDRSFRETKKLPAASVSATGRKLPAVRFACYVMIVCFYRRTDDSLTRIGPHIHPEWMPLRWRNGLFYDKPIRMEGSVPHFFRRSGPGSPDRGTGHRLSPRSGTGRL